MIKTNTERGKVQHKIWKKQNNFSRSLSSIFGKTRKDRNAIFIDILSLLSLFPVLSTNNIRILSGSSRLYNYIYELERYHCVNVFVRENHEYQDKLLLVPNFYEKGMIIESLTHIDNLFNGTILDMKTMRFIALSQLIRKTKTPYRINNNTVLIEITAKGKLVLQQYIKLYSKFFNISEDNVSKIDKVVYGLFTKSVEELKEIVRKKDIIEIILMNKTNREAEGSYYE